MKHKLSQIIPKHARLPLITVLLVNCLVYFGTSLLVDPAQALDFKLPLDDMIPFLPVFIIPYVLAYLQWGVGYIVNTREDVEYCYKIVTADVIAKLICFLCYVILPTTMVRGEITGNDFFSWLTSLIYAADTPINLFPSIHCLESWAVFRCSLKLKLPKAYKIAMGIFSLLVFASTVFVKQHLVIDIPAGILVFELGYLITHLTGIHTKLAKKFGKTVTE